MKKSFSQSQIIKALVAGVALVPLFAFSVTHNVSNATQLRTAMSSAASGDIIVLAAGTYQPSTVVSGIQSLSYANGGIAHVVAAQFVLKNKTNITIKAASATNKPVLKATAVGDGKYIFYAQSSNGLKLENIIFETGEKGAVIDRSDNVQVTGCVFRDIGAEGLHLRDGTDSAQVKNNSFTRIGMARKDRGEALYIGSDKKMWHPDYLPANPRDDFKFIGANDNTLVDGNTFGPDIGAEHVDLKEGTRGAIVRNNTFIGAITNATLMAAEGDYGLALVFDKAYQSKIHNNSFNMLNAKFINTTDFFSAIRLQQIFTNAVIGGVQVTEAGWDLYGHGGKYVKNTVTNTNSKLRVVINPSFGGKNAVVGCDTNGTQLRYKNFSGSKTSLSIDGNDGNTGASVVSGATCDLHDSI
jgi:hypothetical protein